MKKQYWLKGFVFGALLSFVAAFLFMLVGQTLAGGVMSLFGETWLYIATAIPFSIAFAIIGHYFGKRDNLSEKQLWLISLLSALLIALFSGTIGSIIGETIVRGGMETLNISGTLVWGTIYAFVLLPISIPVMKLIINIFYDLIKK